MSIGAKAKDTARQKARQSRPATPAQKQLPPPQAQFTKKESPTPQRAATAATRNKQLPAPQEAKPIAIPTKC
jgi:hypothetical protein